MMLSGTAALLWREYNEELEQSPRRVSIAGRIMTRRIMGKAAFATLQDMSGRIQIYVQKDAVGEETLTAFKQNSTVRSQRDKLAADMVVLVSEDTSACGQASLQITSTTINGVTTSNTDAYAVVRSKCRPPRRKPPNNFGTRPGGGYVIPARALYGPLV